MDIGRKCVLFLWAVDLLTYYQPAATEGYRDGCVPVIFGKSATNHVQFYSRFVLQDLVAVCDALCHGGEDSLAQAIFVKNGCVMHGNFWPSETEIYYLFLQLYYPGSFITTYPAFGDYIFHCSQDVQIKTVIGPISFYLACHDKASGSLTFKKGKVANSHTGAVNAQGEPVKAMTFQDTCARNVDKQSCKNIQTPYHMAFCDYENVLPISNRSAWFNIWLESNRTTMVETNYEW